MAIQSIFVISDTLSALQEMCSGSKALAQSVKAIVFGDESFANNAASCGADSIVYCPVNDEGSPEDYSQLIADEIKKKDRATIFVSNTILGRSLAGRLGVLLDTAVFSNVSDFEEENGELCFKHTVYGGTATRKSSFTAPYGIVTLNAGALAVDASLPATTNITRIAGDPLQPLKRIARAEKHETTVNLAVAKRIVDVGRGLAAESDLDMCRKLASVLDAEVGCSRPVAENNKWLPKANYMGITGVQVKPDLIVVLGVSGQVQHVGGINKSKTIIAINKDKSAPIFKNADFGLVGDMYKIVPTLIDKLS